jgi:hypothetical protein
LVWENVGVSTGKGIQKGEIDGIVGDAADIFLVVADDVDGLLEYLACDKRVGCLLKLGKRFWRDMFCCVEPQSVD